MTYSVDDIKKHGQANTYVAHGEVSDADCILGFSFGYIEGDSGPLPGKSNEQLASYIENKFPATPLILQFEIADALKTRTPDMIIQESREKGEYLNSREIALQALDFSIDLQNMIPIPKKTELQNSIDQSKIERYYQRLIAQYLKLPSKRP